MQIDRSQTKKDENPPWIHYWCRRESTHLPMGFRQNSRDTSELMVLDRAACRTDYRFTRTNSLLGSWFDSPVWHDCSCTGIWKGKHTFRMARSGSRLQQCVIESLKNESVRFCWTKTNQKVARHQKDRVSLFSCRSKWNIRWCYNDSMKSES